MRGTSLKCRKLSKHSGDSLSRGAAAMKRRDFIRTSILTTVETLLAQSPGMSLALQDHVRPHSPPLPLHGSKVSANRRFLADAETGRPFFLLADTAWNLNALTYQGIDLRSEERRVGKEGTCVWCRHN